MTVLEHVRFSRPIGPGTQGKRRFSLGELPRKQRRAWDMWTDAAIETLRQMALEGKSASTIAVALGAPSRNAVIGKANRIGVKLTGHVHFSAPLASRPSKERPRRPAIARTESLGKRAIVPAGPRERKPAWAFAQAQVGEMLKVGLEEIGESACRWPIGDPTTDEFAYCGIQAAKGRSYCAGHCRMAYKPPNSRVWDGQRYVAIESMVA
jgi:GcrA cell cycle regulator